MSEETTEPDSIDLDTMYIEELLALRDRIDIALTQKGYIVYAELTRGDSGDSVIRLQERLAQLGYFTGTCNGKYGSDTQMAMKRFEEAQGLQRDGIASAEDQITLYSTDPSTRPTPVPAATPTPKPTEDPALAEYKEIDYDDLARYPETYIGEKAVFMGKVIQVLGSRTEGYQVRLATSGSDDIVYLLIPLDPGYGILEHDRLTAYCVMGGSITYETIFGQEITLPCATANTVVLR